MKIVYGPGRTLEDQTYMDMMVAELRKKYPPRPKPIKPDGMTDEQFTLSLQAPSTRTTLIRDPKLDFDWINRPLPKNWLAVPDAKNMDEAVNARKLDPIQASHVEAVRRRPKNSLGQSEKSATTEILRNRAIEGFIYTPPAKVTPEEVKQKAVNLVEYKSEPLKEEWVQMPWYKAIIHWFKGNKIDSREVKERTRPW